MLTSFHPNTYFFWGKCFLLSEKTKVQPAQKSGFPVEKAFDCALFLLLSPEYEKGLYANSAIQCLFDVYVCK